MLKLFECLEQVKKMEAQDFLNYWNCKPALLAMALECSDDTVRKWCYGEGATSKVNTPEPVKKAIASVHDTMLKNNLTQQDLALFSRR